MMRAWLTTARPTSTISLRTARTRFGEREQNQKPEDNDSINN